MKLFRCRFLDLHLITNTVYYMLVLSEYCINSQLPDLSIVHEWPRRHGQDSDKCPILVEKKAKTPSAMT